MARGGAIWGFVIYLIFGLYFINGSFSFIGMPGFLDGIDSWLILIGGLLLIVGGVNYFRATRRFV